MNLFWSLVFILGVGVVMPAKILSILPIKMRSHRILFDRLLKELASRGHEITYITPFKSDSPTENITEVTIPDYRHLIMSEDHNTMNYQYMPPFFAGWLLVFFSSWSSDMILNVHGVKEAINNTKYDLVFSEAYGVESILAGVSYTNKAPIVSMSTIPPNHLSNYAVGNPAPSSYITDTMLPYQTKMSFFQRLINLALTSSLDVTQRIIMFLQDRVMRKHFGNDLPYLDVIWKNTSLLLVNHQPALTFPRPQLPNTIDIGGMHIYPPKPLPKDISDFMDNSKEGVILFSLGSNVKSSDFPEETINGILRAFSRIKQNILWKFEKELENAPKNLKIAKWLPQADILAHPNLKLFITHGGFLSTTEAAFRGVPVVGIPVMADQYMNMKNTEAAGFGITLNLNEVSEETIYNAIIEVIDNPQYQETAKLKSKVLNDAPMTPLDTAVWWIEFVLRNKGAPHFRSASQDLYWFQLYQLDTIPILVGGIVGSIALNIWFFKLIVRKIKAKFCKKNSPEKKVQ